MKIFVPTNNRQGLKSLVADHFGRCQTYTVLDEDGRVQKIIENTSEHMGGVGLPPELIKKSGAEVLLCRELGPKALESCRDLGITVYTAKAKTVSEIFDRWQKQLLVKAGLTDVCQEHRQ